MQLKMTKLLSFILLFRSGGLIIDVTNTAIEKPSREKTTSKKKQSGPVEKVRTKSTLFERLFPVLPAVRAREGQTIVLYNGE